MSNSNEKENVLREWLWLELTLSGKHMFSFLEPKGPIDTLRIKSTLMSLYKADIILLQAQRKEKERLALRLLVCGTPKELEKWIGELSTLPGLEGTIERSQPNAVGDRSRVYSEIPEETRLIFENGEMFQPLEHKDDGIDVVITPYKLNRDIVVTHEYKLQTNKLPKRILHNCIPVQKHVPMEMGSRIYGTTDRANATKTVESSRSVSASLGINSPVTVGGQLGQSKTITTPLLQILLGNDESVKAGTCVDLRISSAAKKEDLIFDPVVITMFSLPSDVDPKEIQLDSHFLFFETRNFPQGKKKIKRVSSLSFALVHPQYYSHSSHVVIGGVIGYPQSGKTSFIRAIRDNTKDSVDTSAETPYLYKSHFNNVFIGSDTTRRTFSFVDTRGFYFDTDWPNDLGILDLFVRGLAKNTNFSKNMDLSKVELDATNGVTHMILTIPVRDLYMGVSWIGSFVWSGELKPQMKKFISLYYAMVESLVKYRYEDKFKAKSKIGILVTHMDMLDPVQRNKARTAIISAFKEKDIPDSFVFFGGKECEWAEADLKAHERKVAEFMKRVPEGTDYFDQLKEDNRSSSYLHIAETFCKREGCQHKFTKETQEGYERLLRTFLSTV